MKKQCNSVAWSGGSIVVVLISLALSAHAARLQSDISCDPTAEPLVYDCTIQLSDRETGKPIENAEFVMHTNMPSMPMAHHMRPVKGVPGKAPGVYHGTFHFEMAGEWAIEVRTSAPARDLMRHKVMIHKKGAQPAAPSDKKHKH